MKKIRIKDKATMQNFFTEMEFLPRKGDSIGIPINGIWRVCDIISIVHEFNQYGKYMITEISIESQKQ